MKRINVLTGLMGSLFLATSPLYIIPGDFIANNMGSEARFQPYNGQTVELGGLNHSRGDTMTVIKDHAWDCIDYHPIKLVNNTWGAPSDEKLASAVYFSKDKSFGWFWNRETATPKPGQANVQPIYPSLRVGGNPWERSNSELFPIRLGDIKSLKFEVAYNYPKIPTGTFDLAYDVFLTDTDQANSNPQIKAEVMIWINGTAKQPSNTYKGVCSNGHSGYQIYSWTMKDGRQYYSFIMNESSLDPKLHTVDAKRLVDSLGLNSGWYIHGVELGNEIWVGSGKIEITSFAVNVNGHEEAFSPLLSQR